MAKQLNVNLAFTADTSQAKAQLQALQTSLTQLASTAAISKSGLGIDKEIASAIANVSKLKAALEQATNIKTGKLDLGMFDAQLKKSGLKLQDYAESLYALGPKGAQAFSQLAQSITTAEIPLRRSNALLTEFATTLKNTARWQISSSILHGFMGSVQSAYGYAKDLNESLNNIRIVTGQNTDQMAKFAKEANRAAKALSTTTTDYTDAALIYYQQGLNEEQVKERTDITIKMANVARESAETVSDQLTAVWNNFYENGSQPLEHYADAMTALGATTASSTDEIAGGLEKFASIADMIGLSFDNAAAALATITATTRQSEDVVGTALKTIFARIQGLNLGETLDDGTTLNKYSEALSKVGISIYDAAGGLKDMDDILAEMGAKWDTLSKDQQVALAQTVAGVRQYNQLVSLMDNFDFYEQNLATAQNSEGALDAQAEIYADSWEAAANRVKASLETIYGQLLDDEFFIDLNDGLANVLNTVSDLIDKAGGLKGILLVLSTVMLRTFGASLSKEIERITFNMTLMGKKASQVSETLRDDANQALKSYTNDETIVGSAQYYITQEQATLQDDLIAKNKELLRTGKQITEEEQKHVAQMLDLNRVIGEQVTKTAQAREEEEKITKTLISQATQKMGNLKTGTRNKLKTRLTNNAEQQSLYVMGDLISSDLQKMAKNGATIDDLKKRLAQFAEEADKAGIDISFLNEALQSINGEDIKSAQKAADNFKNVVDGLGRNVQKEFDNISKDAKKAGADMEKLKPIIEKIQQSASKGGKLTKEQTELLQRFGLQAKQTGETIEGLRGRVYTAADGFVALGSTISQVAMTATIFKSTLDTFNSEDATWLDKLTSGAMLLSTVISTLTFVLGKSNREQLAAIPISLAAALGFKVEEEAAEGATVGVISLGAALKFLAKNPYVWAVTAIIAGIAAVCISLYQSSHKAQKAFKTLEKGAKDATSSMQEIKTEVEGLSSALDSLSEKTKALDDLTYGTSQWASAMADVNEEVLDLIDNYNLDEFNADGLANYYRDDRGVMHLTDAGRVEISNKAEAKVETATKAMNATEYARNKGEAAAKREGLINGGYTGDASSSKYQTQYSSRSVSSGIVNVEQRPNHSSRPTSVSSYSSWTSNTPQTTLNAKGIDDTVQALQQGLISKDLLGDTSALIAAGVSQAQAELISSNKFLQDELYNLSIITKENTEAYEAKVANELINNDAVYESIYGTINSEGQQVGGIDEKYRDGAMDQISKDTIKLEEQYLKDITPDDIEEQKSEYAKSFDYGEKDGKYYKKDEHGNILADEEVTISDDAVKQWIAHNKAIETVTKNVDKYTGAVETSNKVWNAAAKLKEKTGDEELSLWEKTKEAVSGYSKGIVKLDDESQAVVDETRGHLQELLRVSDDVAQDLLTPDFIEQNATLIEDAINGDVEALSALQSKLSQDYLFNMVIGTTGEELSAEAKAMLTEVDNQLSDLEVGATLDDSEVKTTLEQMLLNGQITAAQMEKYLGLKGFEGIKVTKRTETVDIPWYARKPIIFGPKQETLTYYDFGGEGGTNEVIQKSAPPIDTSPVLEQKDPSKIIDTEEEPPRREDEDNGNKYKPEIERYHEINREIDNQQKLLDKLGKKKDKAFGPERVAFIEQEIAELEKLKTKQKELLAEQEKDLLKDRAAVQALFPEAKIDEESGEISNFNELMLKTTNEEQAKILKQYEKTLDAIENTKIAIVDLDDEIQNDSLEKITTEVDFEIEINQRDLDKLDYVIDKLGRNLNTAIEQIDALGQQIGKYDNQSQFYRQGIADIKANAAAQGRTLTDDEQRKIWEYEDALLDINGALLDIVETVEAKLLEEFDEFNSKIDENISRFDTYNSMLDHYNNIIKLSGRQTKDSMLLMELSAQKTDTALQKLNASRDKYLANQSVQSDVKEKLDAAIASGNEKEIKYWQEQYDKITKTVEESHNEMLASWEETLEAAGSQFDLAIETTIQTLKDSISEFGLDNLADRYSKGQEEQERYLSNLDKEYELNKLNREISGKIDDTDNIKAKQKLLELQDEINQKLASGEEMSRYDLEHLQKKYELELAKIALEEAQNAKSTVRLSRDSEGNFGYVYTADQDQVDDAQQNYEDKLYDMKKSSEEYLDEMSEKIIQNQQEMMDALAAVDRTKFETQEEYEAELDRIKEYYMGRDKYYRGEMQKAMDELGITYQETLLGQLEGSASLEDAQSKLETNTNEATDKMGQAWKDWHDNVDGAMTEAGTSSATFTEDIKTDAEDIGDATEDLADTIDEQTANMVDYMGRLVDAIADFRDEYLALVDEISTKNEATVGIGFDKDADYSALMNEYLNNGGKTLDKAFQELLKQRNAKVEWLKSEGYDESYWGTSGEDTLKKYQELEAGGGSAEDREWFTKDYMSDEDLAQTFGKLEIPLGALEQTTNDIKTATGEIKTSTDTVGGKIDLTKDALNTANTAINTKTAETGKIISDKLGTTEATLKTAIETTDKSLNTILGEIKIAVEAVGTNTETLSNDIESAANTIVSGVGGVIDDIQSSVDDLDKRVNNIERSNPAGFDTGGYTGSWGPEGKMAILHEKEIVLNQNDTSNLLNTMGIMRDIMNMIDAQASMASLFNMSASAGVTTSNEVLEQSVTIHAEFPNATNHSEIEEAFNNLVNRASQYANRK